jgi:PPOX class probable F420-dependent enzyme
MLGAVALENERYMQLTTFRRDGRAVSTPVWLVHLPGGEIGFSTGGESGKAKRLRHTARVTVQACDRRGSTVSGPVLEGRARLVSGAELAPIRAQIKAKYGAMAIALGVAESVASRVGAKRFGSERVGVIVTLDA